jgi:Icc-related predicted phosphoesterase
MKECAAPLEPAPASEVKVGDRTAQSLGYKLTFTEKDADGALVLGVLGPINEDSGQNMLTLRKYLKFFQDEKADAIVVTGDVGEVADGIARVLKGLGESKLPVLVIAGNRECRAEYTDGVNAARKDYSNIVNMNEFRAVELGGAMLVSLPGYHDPNYINCVTGCRYFKTTVDEVIRIAKDSQVPTVLVAHGPPHGDSSQSLDHASSGGTVGDEEINRAIREGKIPFGLFSNIKEAGARATSDPGGTTQLKPATPSKTLYLNPGPADTVGWEMNDGSKSAGMAAVFTLKDGQGSFKLFKAKPLTAAEKAEAKKLAPPTRSDLAAPKDAAQPPPGEPQKK